MQLLFEAASGEVWAKDRFLELLTTSRGVHVLQWSRGLKSRFGICDVSDHDIAAGQADIETESFLLSRKQHMNESRPPFCIKHLETRIYLDCDYSLVLE